MIKIKINNFGPIIKGYQEAKGYLHINKFTMFIGPQASGKSTVAKLVSTLLWLEKDLIRWGIKEKELKKESFLKNHLKYQNIHKYLKKNTFIDFKGDVYFFQYKNEKFTYRKQDSEKIYKLPKIMYVPAERNFLSIVDRPALMKSLPSTLYTFLDEFENAKKKLKGDVELPINNIKFNFQKTNSISSVVGEGYKVSLSEAASGLQSLIPLYIVSSYLADSIDKKSDPSIVEKSIKERKKVREEIESVISNIEIDDEIKNILINIIASRLKNSHFVNIVEEPEQNLFPDSQKQILFELIKFANMFEDNKLIITTHSPYLINYLSLAIKAKSLKEKINGNTKLKNQLECIVPEYAYLSPEDLSIYELNNDGIINKLTNYNGLPSDENELNMKLAETNEEFTQLLEIESECQ